MRERLLTTREVADMLGLSPEAVLRRWRADELPGFRLSTKVLRFRESEVLAWLEDHRGRPSASPPTGALKPYRAAFRDNDEGLVEVGQREGR